MKSRSHPLLLATLFGLLLAAAALLAASPAQAAIPAADADPALPAAAGPAAGEETICATIDVTVTTINISNEPPDYLIDHLYATLGDVSFFDALTYLKDHSGGIISQEFYDAVDTAPGNEEVKLTFLRDYRRPFEDSVEIAEDGTLHIRALHGAAYEGAPGWETAPCQGGACLLTHTHDPAHYIHTGTTSYAGTNYNYYAFAIAWGRAHTVFLPVVTRGWPAP